MAAFSSCCIFVKIVQHTTCCRKIGLPTEIPSDELQHFSNIKNMATQHRTKSFLGIISQL